MKRFFFFIFVYLILIDSSSAKISINSQKSLINSNVIQEDIDCNKLIELIGGIQQTELLWLGNLDGKKNQFALLNTSTRDENKIFYLCGNVDNLRIETEVTMDILRDRNLIKIFYDSIELFTYIFSITSQESREYIQSTLRKEKFNISEEDMTNAYVAGLMQIDTTTIKKKPKKKKKPKQKKKIEEPKISKDNTAPVLKIASKFSVNSSNYKISGEVYDKESKKVYVKVKDDYTENFVEVVNGKFTIERFSPVSEEILVVAIDPSANKTEKTVKIEIIKKKTILIKAEKLNPDIIKQKNYPNKVALIIGIQDYSNSPKASYANLDAISFYEYVKRGFGVSENNIKLLTDKEATYGNATEALYLWLPGKIKPNVTDLIIFYSGHGLANPDEKELYLLAHDSKTAFKLLPKTALMRSELFDEINKLKPKSVTLFFDTCFSGSTREDESLLVDAKPIRILSSHAANIPDNFTVFSSSLLNQISSGFKEAKNGLFSYYLMKGLEGKADANNDRKITNQELYVYLNKNISAKAIELGREQNPELIGKPNKVLMVYK